MKRTATVQFICFLLILLWTYVTASKLGNPSLFAHQLAKQPLPVWSVGILKWALPTVEMGTAVLLLFQRTRLAGLVLSSVLMVAFTVYVGLALSHSLGKVPCSCGGIFKGMGWKTHLLFNLAFSVLALGGFYIEYTGRRGLTQPNNLLA